MYDLKKSISLHVLLPTLILAMASSLASANNDNATPPSEHWFSLSWDNDLFVGSDGGYTNGVYGTWYKTYDLESEAPRPYNNPPWYFRLQSRIVNLVDSRGFVEILNIGQTMVTPSDIELTPPDPNDVPYSGLAFWQGSILTANDDYADIATLLIGIVGPLSGAEQSQKLVHKVTGSTAPLGWDHQLENEIVFGLNRGRLWRIYDHQFGSLEIDALTGLDGTIGTINSGVNASAFIRIGRQLVNSYATLALANTRESNPLAHSNGFFFYAGISGGYVFNNIFSDGNTYRDGPSIKLEHATDNLTFGAAYSREKWGLSVNLINEGALNNDSEGQQKFGSFSLLWKLD